MTFAVAISGNELLAQDFGIPDSAYFGEPLYGSAGCGVSIRLRVPVEVYSDQLANVFLFAFHWSLNAHCDTVLYHRTGAADSVIFDAIIDNSEGLCSGNVLGWNTAFAPTMGTEEILEFVFTVSVGDTLHIWFNSNSPRLSDVFNTWVPTVWRVDSLFQMPDTISTIHGDCDCSGIVTISDAVYLIQYIFSGGCSPYDLNSADVDASCLVTISDVVYLINYIFAGGPPPQAGCVVP